LISEIGEQPIVTENVIPIKYAAYQNAGRSVSLEPFTLFNTARPQAIYRGGNPTSNARAESGFDLVSTFHRLGVDKAVRV
jgi:hypothetical protein